jgi:hypothetical protein
VLENTARVEGGGVFIYSSNLGPVISQFSVRGNTARGGDGGGLYMRVFLGAGSQPARIENGDISDNTAAIGNGGGVYFSGFSGVQRAELTNVVVKGNSADGSGAGRGGGIYMLDTSPVATNVTIENNWSLNDGGGVWLTVSQNLAPQTQLTSSSVRNNTASVGRGGGIYLHSESNVAPAITGSRFTSNAALNGAGLYLEYIFGTQNVQISSTNFTSNKAAQAAGALYSLCSRLTLSSCVIDSNQAALRGGALYASFYGNAVGQVAGDSQIQLDASTVKNNVVSGGDGGAVYFDRISGLASGSSFSNNRASGAGGAVYALLSTQFTSMTFSSAVVADNLAASGAGLRAVSSMTACYDATLRCTFTSSTCPSVVIGNSEFRSNRATSASIQAIMGGAISVSGVSMAVSGTNVASNFAAGEFASTSGAGIGVVKSCVTIGNSTLAKNVARGISFGSQGGGLASDSSRVSLTSALITSNTAEIVATGTGSSSGGGLFASGSTIEFTDSNILNNSVVAGESSDAAGAGFAVEAQSFVTILRSFIRGNLATGSEQADGGGAAISLESAMTSTDSWFTENVATGRGGGLWCSALRVGSPAVLQTTIISRNSAVSGGGIFLISAAATATNSSLLSNYASYAGGAIYAEAGGRFNSFGGQIVNNTGSYRGGFVSSGNNSVVLDVSTTYLDNEPEWFRETYAPNCIAFGPGIDLPLAGSAQTFNILSRDRLKRSVTAGGESYSVSIVPVGSSNSVNASIVDLLDGTYRVSYMARTSGVFSFHILLDGVDIESSPRTVTIDAGELSIESSRVVPTVSEFQPCQDSSVVYRPLDSLGNALLRGGLRFNSILRDANGGPLKMKLRVDYNSDSGEYSSKFVIPVGGRYKLDLTLSAPNGSEYRLPEGNAQDVVVRNTGTHMCSTVAIGVFAGVSTPLFLVCLVALIFILTCSRKWPVQLSNVYFLLFVVLGLALLTAACVVQLAAPNAHSCAARYWLWGIGWAFLFGAIVSKNLVVWKLQRAGLLKATTVDPRSKEEFVSKDRTNRLSVAPTMTTTTSPSGSGGISASASASGLSSLGGSTENLNVRPLNRKATAAGSKTGGTTLAVASKIIRAKTYYTAPPTDTKYFLIFMSIFIMVEVAVLLFWYSITPWRPLMVAPSGQPLAIADSTTGIHFTCFNATWGVSLFYVWKIVLAIIGIASTLATNDVVRALPNEEVFLAFCLYNLIFIGVLEGLFYIFVADVDTALSLHNACLLYMVAVVFASLVAPKLYFIIRNKKLGESESEAQSRGLARGASSSWLTNTNTSTGTGTGSSGITGGSTGNESMGASSSQKNGSSKKRRSHRRKPEQPTAVSAKRSTKRVDDTDDSMNSSVMTGARSDTGDHDTGDEADEPPKASEAKNSFQMKREAARKKSSSKFRKPIEPDTSDSSSSDTESSSEPPSSSSTSSSNRSASIKRGTLRRQPSIVDMSASGYETGQNSDDDSESDSETERKPVSKSSLKALKSKTSTKSVGK